ncbi:lipopolysaccharide biosynthesis protein [Pedobacter aquatilis]|uniref:lipopolysaccharide biosynthesis protein n=1 Tax=Pedobacter aquatilis TaxID=351343 RepID=UPI00292E7B6C|nr:lipopolysaccharide biosynthesis protein [Pedobacter aquatilis]
MINTIKQIFSIFKNMHFQSLMANGLMAAFGMITLSLVYRTLSDVDMGFFIIFLSVLGLIDNLRAGFLTITIIKFFAGTTPERGREIAGSAWLLAVIIAVLFFAANIVTYFISNHVSNTGVSLILKHFAVISTATLPWFMSDCFVQAQKRFDRMLWLRIFNQGAYTVFVFTLFILKKLTLITLIYAYAASNLFASIMVLVLGWTMVSTIFSASRNTIKELFHFGKYSMGTNISTNLFGITNTFIINYLIGPAALAMYNLGGKLIQVVEIPLLSLITSGMPLLSTSYNQGDKEGMIHTLKKFIGMLTVALVPIVIISLIFAEPFIQLVGGKNYVSNAAPNLFRIFIVLSLLYPADRFFAIGVDVIHLPKINFYKIIIMVISNVAAIFIGVWIYHSVYSIALASIVPTLIAIYMTYKPLNDFYKFSFFGIFSTGFKELILLYKEQKQRLLG